VAFHIFGHVEPLQRDAHDRSELTPAPPKAKKRKPKKPAETKKKPQAPAKESQGGDQD
jgi:hypothetical protein